MRLLAKQSKEAGVDVQMEVHSDLSESRIRPDLLFAFRDRRLFGDVQVTHCESDGALNSSREVLGCINNTIRNRCSVKCNKYNALAAREFASFSPLVISTRGFLSRAFLELLQRLATAAV